MLSIKNKKQMFAAALGVTCLALGAMLLHVRINYEPELREIVRVRAAISTVIFSFPLALFFMYQMLQNHRLSCELQRLVDRDRLTDVTTRDFFFARMEEDPDVYGVSLMIDIDHFKRVNDVYGHFTGDNVIQAGAQITRDQVRDVDIVCRFGGEEFIVFLHQATADEGWVIAERIRAQIEDAPMRTATGAIRVSVSVGGSMKNKAEDVNDAIKRADSCLYRAKVGGRNRTVVDWLSEEDHQLDRAS